MAAPSPPCLGACPICGATAAVLVNLSDETPRPAAGDLTVCGQCGAALAFNSDASLRRATNLDTMRLAYHDGVLFFRTAALAIEMRRELTGMTGGTLYA